MKGSKNKLMQSQRMVDKERGSTGMDIYNRRLQRGQRSKAHDRSQNRENEYNIYIIPSSSSAYLRSAGAAAWEKSPRLPFHQAYGPSLTGGSQELLGQVERLYLHLSLACPEAFSQLDEPGTPSFLCSGAVIVSQVSPWWLRISPYL